MGDESTWSYPGDGEGPVHEVELAPFRIGRAAVTNRQFDEFVEATGWKTDAERYEWSFVFGGLLPDDFPPTRGVEGAPWWRQVIGADWSHPEGPQSDTRTGGTIPSCMSRGTTPRRIAPGPGPGCRRRPSGRWRARGGLDGQPFPWGDELEPEGCHRMNVFQGEFPGGNTGADGFFGTAPVDAFEPNGYGLYNVCGNVWEWCSDWLDLDVLPDGSAPRPVRTAHRLVARPTRWFLPVPRVVLPPLPGVGPLR